MSDKYQGLGELLDTLAETSAMVIVDRTDGTTAEGFIEKIVTIGEEVTHIVVKDKSRRRLISVQDIKGIDWDEITD